LELIYAERRRERDVGSVPAPRHEDAANARHVVARVECPKTEFDQRDRRDALKVILASRRVGS
jgi:hypothetical protein